MKQQPKPSSAKAIPIAFLAIALVLLAINMRAPIVMLGSVAPILKDALGLNDDMIGWLGALPMPAFALGSLLSPYIAKRFGLEMTLVSMIGLITLSLLVRVLDESSLFFMGTAMMAIAIGFVNTLGAPIIKKHAPNHIALMTGLLSLCMSVFAGIIAWAVLPITHAVGWRIGMGLWAFVGMATLIVWLIIARYSSLRSALLPPNTLATNQDKLRFNAWKDINAWVLAVFMGIQSMLFYGLATFLPMIGVAKGLILEDATQLALTFQIAAPFTIIGLTWLVNRGVPVRMVAMMAAVLNTIGVAGLIWLPRYLHLWSLSMGLGAASIFTLSLMMFSLRTHDSDTARDVSGMVQAVGYSIAFFGPLMLGKLFNYYQDWQTPLTALLVLMVVNVGVAWFATRPYIFGQ
ncbi:MULTISPECIES: CynX/NimT family MFS transporter [unclassified Moraxella]|uniref:MFS transporter n=1 Tax=unclassified Moraxella TaxID=2685852 RepID=UPI00359DCE1F